MREKRPENGIKRARISRVLFMDRLRNLSVKLIDSIDANGEYPEKKDVEFRGGAPVQTGDIADRTNQGTS
jgi:hypothetical protein